MTRAKRRYHVTVQYFDLDRGAKITRDVEEHSILAFDEEDAELRLNLKFKISDNPKVRMYDGWECCINKF